MGDEPARRHERVAGAERLHRRRAPGPGPGGGRDPSGKDTGLGHFPSFDYGVNQAWLAAAMIASILLAWLKLLALDGDLATAEPRTLRTRPARRGPAGTRRPAAPPENPGLLAVGRGNHRRLAPHRRAPASTLTSTNPSQRPERTTRARGTPGHPARQPGHRHTPALNPDPEHGPEIIQRQPSTPMKDQG